MAIPRLAARHVSKTYGATKVLDDAELVVHPGEIHALIGQNGSGKSTLVKILTGYHGPDAGASLDVDGVPLATPVRWSEAQDRGVAVVYQDMGLLDHLTVSENIGVGSFVRNFWGINWKKQDELARKTLARLGFDIDSRALVGDLPPALRAAVAIARALKNIVPGEGVVILDEATRALPHADLTRVHQLLTRVVETGTAVLMVSHNLEEVLAMADKVTILRDGRVAAGGIDVAGLTESDLARHMLGQTVGALQHVSAVRDDLPAAAVITGLTIGCNEPVDITVRAGEIVGVTGLPGTGFEQLPYLMGGGRRSIGTVVTPLGRVNLERTSVEAALAAGVALVPERRLAEGLASEMSIRDNLALPLLKRRGRPLFVSTAWQEDLAYDSIAKLGIKTRGPSDLVRELSGGNQQKVLLAKWLSVDPTLLVLHEPTQAVDVGARADILKILGSVAASGKGVLLFSTEPTDLVESCDRILVLHPDRPVQELRTTDPDDVLNAIYGEAHV